MGGYFGGALSKTSSDLPPPRETLAEVGRYRRFSEGQDHGLIAAALDLPYWLIRQGPDFILYVESEASERVRAELAKYDEEQKAERSLPAAVATPLPKLDTLPLFAGAWVFCSFWAAQNVFPPSWIDRGEAFNHAIFAGQWWRTITGLTLHGDLAHFLANLFFGIVFIAFLLPRFGTGASWLGTLLAGAMGNAINAGFYRSEPHSTIGASTAVFGALGLLVAWEFVEQWRVPQSRGWWKWLVPLGGGLALLAILGSGDGQTQRVDYMAHFWGFLSGLVLGIPAAGWRARERLSARIQRILWATALLLIALAWGMAAVG
jgi:membrane associated rhomboid family serine protease